MEELSPLMKLEADLDMRLMPLLSDLFQMSQEEDVGIDLDNPVAIAWIRGAYGLGYSEALSERKPGKLFRAHGFRLPARRS